MHDRDGDQPNRHDRHHDQSDHDPRGVLLGGRIGARQERDRFIMRMRISLDSDAGLSIR